MSATRCTHPVDRGNGVVPCRQCTACMVSTRRQIAGRILLEAAGHEHSAFITLTYSDEALPRTVDGIPTVRKAHAKKFIEDLARVFSIKRSKVRHFTVGEYGTESGRPHLHSMVFGIKPWDAWDISESIWRNNYGYGFVQATGCNPTRANYIAGYSTKKLTKAEDDRLGPDQEPEFKIQVHQPALGAPFINKTIEWYHSYHGCKALAEAGDICHVYRYKGQVYPWTWYHRKLIRKGVGIPTRTAELRDLRPDAHPIATPPTLQELDDRRQRELNRLRRLEIYGQKTQRI